MTTTTIFPRGANHPGLRLRCIAIRVCVCLSIHRAKHTSCLQEENKEEGQQVYIDVSNEALVGTENKTIPKKVTDKCLRTRLRTSMLFFLLEAGNTGWPTVS